MTEKEFNSKVDRIYYAIRQYEGYTDEADELVDFAMELADIAEDEIVKE